MTKNWRLHISYVCILLICLTVAIRSNFGSHVLKFIGRLVIVGDSYAHPGTPLSIVRHTKEDNALVSTLRLSVRPIDDAQPGSGSCIIFQQRLVVGQPDVDMGELCVRVNELGGGQFDLILRDSDGNYHTVLSLDAESRVYVPQ